MIIIKMFVVIIIIIVIVFFIYSHTFLGQTVKLYKKHACK